jgi:hypothetical protein
MKPVLRAALVVALTASPLAAQEPVVKAKIIARMQAQFNTTSVDEQALITSRGATALPASQFEMRRLRLGAELSFDEWLTGKFEFEAAMARLAMRDVYLQAAFSDGFQVKAGQFKKSFSLIELTSETGLPVIERGVRIRGLTDALAIADSTAGGTRVLSSFKGTTLPGEEQELIEVMAYKSYDLGAAVTGKLGGFGYEVGLFNGPGSDRADDNSGKSIAARATYKLKTKMPVTLGAALSRRDYRVASKPAIIDETGTAYEAEIEIGAFRRPGLHFLGEVTMGTTLGYDDEFTGAQGILAWFKPVSGKRVEGIEVAGRASYGDPRGTVDDDEGLLLTPGFNVYFQGRNRFMINWDIYQALGDRLPSENALRIQAQLYY